MPTELPIYDTDEAIDLRALTYVGPDPEMPQFTIFSGAHGLPFYLAVESARALEKDGKQPLEASLLMPQITPTSNNAKGTIGWSLHHAVLVKMTVAGGLLDALPTDHRERALCLIEQLARLLDPTTPRFKNGTLEELKELMQATVNLTDLGVDLVAAATENEQPLVRQQQPYGLTESKSQLVLLLTNWFYPIWEMPDLSKSNYADRRKACKVGYFPPPKSALTAHERMEALSPLLAWLKARYEEGTIGIGTLKTCLQEIGAPDALP